MFGQFWGGSALYLLYVEEEMAKRTFQLRQGGCDCAVKRVICSSLPVIEGEGLRTENANTLQQEMVCLGQCVGEWKYLFLNA